MNQEINRLFDLLPHQLEHHPKEDCLGYKKDGNWHKISTREFVDKANRVSMGLIKLGIEKGQTVGIISMNRPEWNFVDMGTLQVGAITVPLYPTASVEDYEFILNHAQVRVVFVEKSEYAQKLLAAKAKAPSIIEIISFELVDGLPQFSGWINNSPPTDDAKIKSINSSVMGTDAASYIYTSGTTGQPKGVILSHENVMSNVRSVKNCLPFNSKNRALSFLPLCHILERMVNYTYQYVGVSIYYAENMETIADNLREIQPHYFATVPRLLEKVFNKIVAKGEILTGLKRKLFFWALELGLAHNPDAELTLTQEIQLGLARKLIFSKWQEALGGQIIAVVSGGAALQSRLTRVFWAAGIPVLEGYGLTETSPVLTVNTLTEHRVGAVGTVIPGVQVRIEPEPGYKNNEGEILAKGPNVMTGYYKNPEATAEVMTSDGWFRTGDIGMFTEDGFLRITDRKKEVFKTSGGKYIAPLALEQKFKESLLIEQVMVVGENQKFPSALIVPAFAYAKEWLSKQGETVNSASELIKNKTFTEELDREIKRLNQNFGQWEQVKKLVLLPNEWTIDGGELTPSLKLKRRIIKEKFKKEIENIYL